MSSLQDRLMKQAEAELWTCMSSAWFEQNRFKGTGIPYVKIGRSVRYRESDISRFIADHVMASGI